MGLRTRRCVIPASWYYEWGVSPTAEGYNTLRQQRDIKKTRFTIQTAGAEIVFLAGLYRYEEHSGKQIPMFSIITREAVEPVRSIHDRMPLMLRQKDVRDWVQPDMNPSGIPERALTDVIMEEASV